MSSSWPVARRVHAINAIKGNVFSAVVVVLGVRTVVTATAVDSGLPRGVHGHSHSHTHNHSHSHSHSHAWGAGEVWNALASYGHVALIDGWGHASPVDSRKLCRLVVAHADRFHLKPDMAHMVW